MRMRVMGWIKGYEEKKVMNEREAYSRDKGEGEGASNKKRQIVECIRAQRNSEQR